MILFKYMTPKSLSLYVGSPFEKELHLNQNLAMSSLGGPKIEIQISFLYPFDYGESNGKPPVWKNFPRKITKCGGYSLHSNRRRSESNRRLKMNAFNIFKTWPHKNCFSLLSFPIFTRLLNLSIFSLSDCIIYKNIKF